MDELTVPEWKSFLGARITQENGDDGKALEIFDELLKLHPTNPSKLATLNFHSTSPSFLPMLVLGRPAIQA